MYQASKKSLPTTESVLTDLKQAVGENASDLFPVAGKAGRITAEAALHSAMHPDQLQKKPGK